MDNWIKANGYDSESSTSLYLVSFYFTITTMTTVGYGDISATNTSERLFAIVIMVTGQVAFTYAISLLGQIVQSIDVVNQKFNEKVVILNRLYKDFYLPIGLYTRLKQSLRYKYNKDMEDLNEFVDELPQNLKVEVSLFIHESTYRVIEFFQGRSDSFIAWICPLLKP